MKNKQEFGEAHQGDDWLRVECEEKFERDRKE